MRIPAVLYNTILIMRLWCSYTRKVGFRQKSSIAHNSVAIDHSPNGLWFNVNCKYWPNSHGHWFAIREAEALKARVRLCKLGGQPRSQLWHWRIEFPSVLEPYEYLRAKTRHSLSLSLCETLCQAAAHLYAGRSEQGGRGAGRSEQGGRGAHHPSARHHLGRAQTHDHLCSA